MECDPPEVPLQERVVTPQHVAAKPQGQAAMESTLLSMPPEVLENIIFNITGPSTLARLARAHKALRSFALSKLYREVKMTHWPADEITPIGSRSRFVAFIETILTSNELASMVRTLHIANRCKAIEHPTAIRNYLLKVAPDNTLLQALRRICDGKGPTDYWHQAIYVLVPMMLPRLRSLKIDDIIGFCDSFGQDIYEKLTASAEWPHFQDLQDVCLTPNTSASEIASSRSVAFFTFVGVPHIYSCNQTDSRETNGVVHLQHFPRLVEPWLEVQSSWVNRPIPLGPFHRLEPGQSRLQFLELGGCSNLEIAHLEALLRAPRALRGFCYCLTGPSSISRSSFDELCNTHGIQTAIEHQRESLEYLSIYNSDFFPFSLLSTDGRNSILPMVFKTLNKLKTLEVSLPFVFGAAVLRYENSYSWGCPQRREWGREGPSAEEQQISRKRLVEMLPSSIETVRFAQCGDEWASRLLAGAILQLLQQRDQFPCLRKVEMHGHHDKWTEGTITDIMKDSFEAAREAGIDVTTVWNGRLASPSSWEHLMEV